MSKKYIRVKADGFIYEYNEILAQNPACEVVTEEEAFPERFIPTHAAGRKKKGILDLTTNNIPEPPPYTPPELAAEVSRGLP